MRPSSGPPGRPTQRSALVHGGGRCVLRCAVCDCTAPASTPADLARALEGGGARLVVRGSTEHSAAIGDIIGRARRAGFAQIMLRTNAIESRAAAAAARFAHLGADAVLVPLFSQAPAVHDGIAGRPRALLDALAGMRNLAHAGLAIEIEVPILPLSLQRLEDVVRLAHKAVPSLRAVRFFAPTFPLPNVLAPPAWDIAAPALARALLLCRELRIRTPLTADTGVPLCALRNYADLYDTYVFNPRARSARLGGATFGAACERCAVRAQCPGLLPAYWAANGEAGITPYAQRPALMYAQRTTRRRVWTGEQRAAAARADILVLRPTVNCNQDCTFCSANETSANVWADHHDMLRAIARAARRGVFRVSFSGGEPTLSKHLVEYVRCASRLGIPKVEIVSNAVLLDKKERVTALAEAGLTHAFISLHAHDEELSRQATQKAGDFARTVQGIRNLLQAGVDTALNHVITARNYPYLTRFVEFVHREFAGWVKISFAFVTPQFKALDNIELMPRLSDVMPHLKRAMYRALELGQPFTVGSRQGIPFCFLDEFRAWSDGFLRVNVAVSEDSPQKQRGPRCDDCRFSDYCTGLWRPYVAKYGFDELRPVPGGKLTESEAEEMRRFRRPKPEPAQGDSDVPAGPGWAGHIPMRFDQVPAAIREPALEIGPPALTRPAAPPSQSACVLQRTRPLRLAVLGSGRQARRLARAAREVPGLSIDAVASPHALQADMQEFGGCPVYADAAEALDDIRPEAVIIAAATAAHDTLACLAITRGIPALLEKPITSSVEQALALRDTARAAGACVVPAHNSLYPSGLDEVFAMPMRRAVVACVWRRTPRSDDMPPAWSRSSLYETVYHLLAVTGRAVGGGVGQIVNAAFRGIAVPEYLRLELRYGDAIAEVVLDFAAAVEEDVVSRREADVRGTEQVWRRQGRAITITSPGGVRAVEAQGSDVQRMLANFRDVVLGSAAPGATLDEACDVMRTAYSVVDAVAAAGVPFERPNAPTHVSSLPRQQRVPEPPPHA